MARKSKRRIKKILRKQEKRLNSALKAFVEGYDFSFPTDGVFAKTPEEERQFRLLLRLRGLAGDFLWLRLKTDVRWRGKAWYLDFLSVDDVRVTDDRVQLSGDIVWWAEGAFAREEWWPKDHEVHPTGFYRRVLRGDTGSLQYVIEPVKGWFGLARNDRRDATYEIKFGFGSTYLKVSNLR